MPKWKNIVVHHSASGFGTAIMIHGWHKKRGWNGIGYHYVILNGYPTADDLKSKRRDEAQIGRIECGRTLDGDEWVEHGEQGAHALGFNKDSLGICLIHKTLPYHPKMYASLIQLLGELIQKYKIDPQWVVGHYELSAEKPKCPSIDMHNIRKILYELYP